MMPKSSRDNAIFTIKDPLQHVLTFLDCLDIPETTYVTGRPGVPRKSMLKCFIIKTYFGIASLRKLVRFLDNYPYWRWIVGLPYVPHLSTFSRAATWWRTEGFSLLHTAVLKRLPVDTKLVVIDSTALRSSLYDPQAEWGKSTRYKWYKGKALDLLRSQHTGYERLPHDLINKQTLKKWKEVLQMLDQVCNRLFSSGTQSIADHIRLPENELMKLMPKRLRSAEKQVLEQIRKVFKELSTYYSIEGTVTFDSL